MVVGVGFEPTNARSGRIYSPHPLATWIPYRNKNKEIYRNTNLRQADYGAKNLISGLACKMQLIKIV